MTIKRIIQLCLFSMQLPVMGMTTLKHFDPAPVYSANDSMVPPNSQFLDLAQARIKGENPSKRRVFGLNFSGFVQRAIRARGYTGQVEFGSVLGVTDAAKELGNFRGTPDVMGLFLGKNPSTGQNIWINGTDNGNPANLDITRLGLPDCLENIGVNMKNLIFGLQPTQAAVPCVTGPTCVPFTDSNASIFSESYLDDDSIYFGAFSLPIEYQQAGMRWEVNVNCADYLGLTIQGGMSVMRQKYVESAASSSPTVGPYSLSARDTATGSANLYSKLNFYSPLPSNVPTPAPTLPNTAAQALFDQNISNNILEVFDDKCFGSNPFCGFEKYSIDDVNIILHFKKVYDPFHDKVKVDEDDSWPDMIFTPYLWVGGTVPLSKKMNYHNILSLPFGNNGHFAAAGGIGMTFDFAESVEVGFEGSVTHFLPRNEHRPFPTHKLQRLLFPFQADVTNQPGMNWSFKALLNCYQFISHCNFWMTYQLIEHSRDCFTLIDKATAQYFVPDVLTCHSDWRSQMLNMGLSFDIQPGIQASVVWQQPISPRNAYYPVSIIGSINFMF